MKTILKGFIFIVGITTINSCEKTEEKNLHDQKIYFEHYAINYSFGLSNVHWIIDNQGNVRKNKKQDSLIWISPDKLNDYVEMFDTVIYKVDKNELDYYINLIPYAANGEISQIEQNRRDYGGNVYNCYKQVDDSFEIVVLSEMSNVLDKTNLDSNAVKIDEWLKELQKTIY